MLQLSMSRALVQMSVGVVYHEALLIFSETALERAMIAFPSLSRDSRSSGFLFLVSKPLIIYTVFLNPSGKIAA